jgi:hypothetical protein
VRNRGSPWTSLRIVAEGLLNGLGGKMPVAKLPDVTGRISDGIFSMASKRDYGKVTDRL